MNRNHYYHIFDSYNDSFKLDGRTGLLRVHSVVMTTNKQARNKHDRVTVTAMVAHFCSYARPTYFKPLRDL